MDKVRECVGYCFRRQSGSRLRRGRNSFQGKEGTEHKAIVIKSRFLLYANGVAIQKPSNEHSGLSYRFAVRKLRDFDPMRKVRALLIRSSELYVCKCVSARARAPMAMPARFIRERYLRHKPSERSIDFRARSWNIAIWMNARVVTCLEREEITN